MKAFNKGWFVRLESSNYFNSYLTVSFDGQMAVTYNDYWSGRTKFKWPIEKVQDSKQCAKCRHYNHKYNGCNHGHNNYCGRGVGGAAMKCIKCGHRRLSRVFLGYECRQCSHYYFWPSGPDGKNPEWDELLEKQKYTCKQLKEKLEG